MNERTCILCPILEGVLQGLGIANQDVMAMPALGAGEGNASVTTEEFRKVGIDLPPNVSLNVRRTGFLLHLKDACGVYGERVVTIQRNDDGTHVVCINMIIPRAVGAAIGGRRLGTILSIPLLSEVDGEVIGMEDGILTKLTIARQDGRIVEWPSVGTAEASEFKKENRT